jgi:hypothetical protein
LGQETRQGLHLILQSHENESPSLALMPPVLRMYIPRKEAKEVKIWDL